MHKRIQSFGYAIKGIRAVIASETNMQIHVFISISVIIAGFALKISTTEWLLCLLCIALVLALEMLNTAIEHTIDLVSPEKHILAGKAKDAAAGAVLIGAVLSAIIGSLIFAPKLIISLQNLLR